uniref:non-specific serine/threonine protein kinase n=1 Tax=Eptatretus burgeri TaxID=7764 RepID=A0A8C4NME0_EPTBU
MERGQPTRLAVKRHQHKHNLKHRYEFLETLGKGTYGKVKKALERSTGRMVAVKTIRKDKVKDEADMVHVRREIEITSSLIHPHIISIYEVFENQDKIVIVMEYASQGELYDYVSERRKLPESEARRFFRQMVSALHHCHKNGVVHRDLKLENVLLDSDCNVKIADFGLSSVFRRGSFLQTFCGSPLYASPEIVNGRPYQGPEVDSWALGVLLYTLVYGTMPFDGRDYKTLVRQISHGEYHEPSQPSDACGLIRWMLMVNPERRATIEDIANHWWVNWGHSMTVCDCDTASDARAPSPLVARFIDLHRRAAQGRGDTRSEGGSKSVKSIPKVLPPFLQKSPKENNVTRPIEEHKPKGILKKRSEEEDFLKSLQNFTNDEASVLHLSSMSNHPEGKDDLITGPKIPKKGILKKVSQRESGYYSSPERSDSTDGLDAVSLRSTQRKFSTGNVALRKKGILKRDGKFFPTPRRDGASGPLSRVACSLEDLLVFDEGQPLEEKRPPRLGSRPSSVLSDDSVLSSESFDRLELSGTQLPLHDASDPHVEVTITVVQSDSRTTPLAPSPRSWQDRNYHETAGVGRDEWVQTYKQALEICRRLC